MLYWQERELERFRDANPELEFQSGDLEEALRFCEIHEVDLLPCQVEIFRGHLHWAQDYLKERSSCFPHASLDPVMIGEGVEGEYLESWYCPECRDLATKWHSKQI